MSTDLPENNESQASVSVDEALDFNAKLDALRNEPRNVPAGLHVLPSGAQQANVRRFPERPAKETCLQFLMALHAFVLQHRQDHMSLAIPAPCNELEDLKEEIKIFLADKIRENLPMGGRV